MGNIELLKKTKEHMLANPEIHSQGTWISFPNDYGLYNSQMCHTTMCTAGHAAVLAGAEIPTLGQYLDMGWTLDEEGKLSYNGLGVASWAEEKLGLTGDEYNYLFFCLRKEDLFPRIDQIIGLWESGQEFNYVTCEIIGETDED